MKKLYRVYFNRLSEQPQIWGIDEGTQTSEINVSSVSLVNCSAETKCDLEETVNRDRPKAWIEVRGHLRISQGVAIITGGSE